MKKYLIVILIFGVFSTGVFLPKDFNSQEELIFKVEKGWSSKEIALNLEKDGLIWWSPIFRIYVLVSGKIGSLQAGTYLLTPAMNIPRIAEKITSGDIAKAEITIPEGFTAEQIHEKLKDVMESDLASLEENEGYLFPDTYEIAYGTQIEKILQMMKDNFDKKTADLEITPEIIVMASLIEKEIRTFEDKQLVSGILWKRLRAGIPLQVDATITYITGKRTTQVPREDTQIDSPYNTYKYYGLPPGPICNPSLESIEAAINPQNSPYWYYLSKPEGETIFSKTLQEHNIAKAKYLK